MAFPEFKILSKKTKGEDVQVVEHMEKGTSWFFWFDNMIIHIFYCDSNGCSSFACCGKSGATVDVSSAGLVGIMAFCLYTH